MSAASKRARQAYRTEWVDRWLPPKPLVGLPIIEKVLNRHTRLDCPESRLVVTMIARAIGDCLSLKNSLMRRGARRFLLGDDLTLWCDLIDLDSDFVRFVARKAGYLADEKAHWQKVPIKVRVPAKSAVSASSVSHNHPHKES